MSKIYSPLALAAAFTGASFLDPEDREEIQNNTTILQGASSRLGVDEDELSFGPEYTKYKEDVRGLLKQEVPELETFALAMRAYVQKHAGSALTDDQKNAGIRQLAEMIVPAKQLSFIK